MENKKIERMTVDGRRAEVHTVEQPVEGVTQRITEHFEEIIPLEKKKKVIERIVPVVVERVTEQYNSGRVDKVVERVTSEDPSLRLHLVPENHPVTADEVEDIVRKILNSEEVSVKPVVATKGGFFGWFGRKTPVTPVAAPVANNSVIAYALITLLAVQVGFLVWQLFIR